MPTTKEKYVRPVSDGQALSSLRHSSFDFYHALCETIDNSIQSNAKNINIFTETRQEGRIKRITEVACIDDGDGMTPEILHNCLALGYGTRYGDRNGIGRFGVGMTLASISQCKRIEVYSKLKDSSELLGTYLDLDEFDDIENPSKGIPTPKSVKLIKYNINDIAKGSLVIWKKCDRVDLPHHIDDLEKELHFFIGRTYRYWLIKKEVSINYNGKPIYFYDPLFENKSLRFPEDPISKTVLETEVPYPIPSEIIEKGLSNGETHSQIKIKMSLLPEEFRKEMYGGGKDFPDRFLDRNEGVSILRANREVHYDHIKHYSPKFKEVDRWWACEISFEPVLDECFKILNIKLGVRLEKELRDLIKAEIEPTRKRFCEEISAFWSKGENRRDDSSGDGNLHGPAERAAQKSKYKPKKVKKKTQQEIDDENKKMLEQLAKDLSAKEKNLLLERIKTFKFTIEESPWPGDLFLDTTPATNENMVLIYNSRHPFFKSFYEPIRKIRSDSKYSDDVKQLAAVVDLLLISFCGAQKNFDDDEEYKASVFFNRLLKEWGEILHNFVKELD